MSTYTHESMIVRHAPGFTGRLLGLLHTWRDRRRDRRELALWSMRDMYDAGVSPGDVQYEARKPFWQA